MAFDRTQMIADLESPACEDFRSIPYDDATGKSLERGSVIKGNITDGIGWAMGKRPLTREQARIICGWHVDETEQALSASLPWFPSLDDVRSRALINMAFAMGAAGVMGFPHMLEAMRDHLWDVAASEALNSVWARVEEPHRAALVAAMIRTGIAP